MRAYPIEIKQKNQSYFTLMFEDTELLLMNNEIICYKSLQELLDKEKNNYEIDDSLYIHDFTCDEYVNPINYDDVLTNWNLLNTIAGYYGMYFEGDAKKRTYTYNYLFCCVTSNEKLPKAINLPQKCVKDIFFVFKKKDRILKKLHYVNK